MLYQQKFKIIISACFGWRFYALKNAQTPIVSKAAGVMRRARLADGLHRLKVSVLRGYKRAIMITIITITNVLI